MRNFFAKSALAAVVLSLAPVAAQASTARIEGLGLQGDYVQDYTNIYNYPASIVRYQNLVYGNWGRKDVSGGDLSDFTDNNPTPSSLENADRSMGAYLSICKRLPGTWGVQINENRNALSPAYGPQYWGRQGNEGITLLWGNKIGSKAALGITLEKSGSRAEDATDVIYPYFEQSTPAIAVGGLQNTRQIMNDVNASLGATTGRNSWGIGAGLSSNWSSNGRDHLAELGVHYRNNSLHEEDQTAGTLLEDNGNTDFAVNARLQLAISDNSYLTPVANWYSMDRGTQFTDNTTPANNFDYENKVSGFNVGLSETWVLRETDMLVMGVSVNREKIDYEDPSVAGGPFTITYMNSPTVFGALEAHPTHWWHVRMGASKPVWSKLTLEQGSKTEFKDSPFNYAVGTGFRLGGSLDLDAVVNQDFAFGGGWASSGTFEVPFSSLSATYRF